MDEKSHLSNLQGVPNFKSQWWMVVKHMVSRGGLPRFETHLFYVFIGYKVLGKLLKYLVHKMEKMMQPTL